MKTITSRIRNMAAAGLLAGAAMVSAAPATAETIKVGILHSLSGTMAISETTLKDAMLMLIDDLNKSGGLLGKQVEPVVVDPASDWPLFAEKARELIEKEKVAVVFGCWTSVSRKSVLPVFEELNGLLFYPVQYEGEESSRNVFYTGAAPNQQAIPAVEYLMSEDGGGAERFALLGTDYVYPRTTNKILRAFLHWLRGISDEDILDQLHALRPFRLADDRLGRSRAFARSSRQEDRHGLDDQWRRQRAFLQGTRQPGHEGRGHAGRRLLRRRGGTRRHRHRPAGRSSRRVELLHVGRDARSTTPSSRSGTPSSGTRTASPTTRWKPTIIGFNMWVQAVNQAGSTDVDAVRQAIIVRPDRHEPDRHRGGDECPTITSPSRC